MPHEVQPELGIIRSWFWTRLDSDPGFNSKRPGSTVTQISHCRGCSQDSGRLGAELLLYRFEFTRLAAFYPRKGMLSVKRRLEKFEKPKTNITEVRHDDFNKFSLKKNRAIMHWKSWVH